MIVSYLKKHILVRTCMPSPQDVEHKLQVDQDDHEGAISLESGTGVSSNVSPSGSNGVTGAVLSQNGGVVVENPSILTVVVSGVVVEGVTGILSVCPVTCEAERVEVSVLGTVLSRVGPALAERPTVEVVVVSDVTWNGVLLVEVLDQTMVKILAPGLAVGVRIDDAVDDDKVKTLSGDIVWIL